VLHAFLVSEFALFFRVVPGRLPQVQGCCTTLPKQRETHYNLENPELSLEMRETLAAWIFDRIDREEPRK
jgi:hypothetical protein